MFKIILTAFADEIDPSVNVQMDVLDEHGIKYIEMRGADGKNIADLTIDEAKDIKKRLDARGFKVSAAGSPIGKIKITDPFEAHLNKFRHVMDVSDILETKMIRLFSFLIPKEENPADYRDEVMRRMGVLCSEAEKRGFIIAHENEKHIYGDTPERCLDIVKTINSPNLKLIFDPANFVQCDVKAWPESFMLLKDYIVYLHIKDAKFDTKAVVPSGMGDGHIVEILKELKRSNYSGFLSIEPHLGNFKGFELLEPGNTGFDLPEGGPKQFAIAVRALKDIISSLTV